MTFREYLKPLFRCVTAIVFVAAIGLLRTEPVLAVVHGGTCAQNEIPFGCDETYEGFSFCWDAGDCVYYAGTRYLCYCMSDYNCGWWPNGCQ